MKKKTSQIPIREGAAPLPSFRVQITLRADLAAQVNDLAAKTGRDVSQLLDGLTAAAAKRYAAGMAL
jgi:hypothetical protein